MATYLYAAACNYVYAMASEHGSNYDSDDKRSSPCGHYDASLDTPTSHPNPPPKAYSQSISATYSTPQALPLPHPQCNYDLAHRPTTANHSSSASDKTAGAGT